MTLKSFLHHLNLRDTRLFPRIKPLAKFLLIFTLITGSIFLTTNILAQNNKGYGNLTIETDSGAVEELGLKQQAAQKPNNLESWNFNSSIDKLVFINTGVGGDITKDTASGNWVPGGLIGFTNKSIATLYQPPISGVQYIAQTIDNFLGKPTYAANGFGFDKLSGANGIMSLWKTVRNAVYSLFSLFFIILGIMIMLRIKISPQATISIQVILPKIIISLVLVTFSYAIVGLLIDFSYVFQGVILSLIFNTKTDTNKYLNTIFTTYDIPNLMNLNFWGIQDITQKYFISDPAKSAFTGIASIVGLVLGAFMGGGSILSLKTIGLGLAGFTIGLTIINIIIFIFVVKLFFGLAKCYINILLKIVTAPLEIGLGVFPGSKVNFSSWIVQLIANLVVFPATIIFLVIIAIFVSAVTGGNDGTNAYFWAPNILANGEVVGFIIGLTGLMLLSKIPQIVPEFLFNIKPSPMNKMISDSYKDWGGLKTLAHSGPGTYLRAKGMEYGGDTLNKLGKNIQLKYPGSKFGKSLETRGNVWKEVGEMATGKKDAKNIYLKTKAEKYIK